jgi:ligand-binding SRPBCC domain-containing protein
VVFRYQSIVPVAAPELFGWHQRPEALLDLVPFRRLIRIEEQQGGLHDGGTVTMAMGWGPLRLRWKARHFGFIQDQQFCDEQVSGPFAIWRHTHRVEATGHNQSVYEDRVECLVPGGKLINRMCAPILRRLLTRMFEWRHQVVHDAVGRTR